MTEDQLLEHVTELAQLLDVLLFHAHDSRRDLGAGFPDLVIAGPAGHLFRELKAEGENLRPDQQRWRYRLLAGGGNWDLWRPRDWRSGRIHKELNSIL